MQVVGPEVFSLPLPQAAVKARMGGELMAQKYLVQVIDDLDGTELDGDDVQQVHFGLDGIAYVIDLSTANAQQLRTAMTRYTDAARRNQVTGRASASTKSSPPAAEGRKNLEQVRAWANENGHTVSTRGRIPNAILAAYDAR